MYSKTYGEGKNYSKQNRIVLRERTLRQRTEFYKSAPPKCIILSTYGPPKKREKPHVRDSRFWEKKLDSKSKEKLNIVREADKAEEEKLVIEEKVVEELKKDILMVQDQDLHVEENAKDHNTDEYDCVEDEKDPQIVVRRGQEFKVTLTFQRPWEGKIDDLYLIFKLGEKPNRNKGTFAKIKLEEGNDTSYKDGNKKDWGARILNKGGNNLTIAIYSPPKAIIGEWEFAIQTVKVEKPKNKIFQCLGKDNIIILLNPWCKDDQVYMPEQDKLAEYIENEYGISFFGSSNSIRGKAWNYGQFQEKILEISLHLLRKAFDYEVTKKMGNPVFIARALSRILNDCDDMGVLSGNWSGEYAGGTKPTGWKGSKAILEEYYEDREPVKYGQCWVFSHVLTTVARALGLPCRSVTNFSSAHDTNLSLTIDKYIDADGDIDPYRSSDSTWNFHVWNEVWMSRPDLDIQFQEHGKYDGWHAIDATPQETSDYMYQCGPSPLAAIQNGEMHVGYDTRFIFAEVNADVCTWRDDGDGPVLIKQETDRIGKNISTKSPTGKPMVEPVLSFFSYSFEDCDRLDVTHLYKHPEGSIAEREAVEKALADGDLAKVLFSNPTGVSIEILPVTPPKLGEDFTAVIKVENKANDKRSVRVSANVRPMTYWGDVIGTRKIASNIFTEVALQPGESQTFESKIECERYMAECDSHLTMSVLAMGVVRDFEDWENSVYTSEDIQVQGPKLLVKGPKDPVKAGELVTVQLELTNPLGKDLNNCTLTVEGSAKVEDKGFELKHSVYKKKIENIKAKETRRITLNVKPSNRPKRSKEREVEFGIDCDELPEVEGSLSIKLH